MTRGAKVTQTCKWCKDPFTARVADVKRGWAKFCSKSCKAKQQEASTGQYASLLNRVREQEEDEFEPIGYEYDAVKGWLA